VNTMTVFDVIIATIFFVGAILFLYRVKRRKGWCPDLFGTGSCKTPPPNCRQHPEPEETINKRSL